MYVTQCYLPVEELVRRGYIISVEAITFIINNSRPPGTYSIIIKSFSSYVTDNVAASKKFLLFPFTVFDNIAIWILLSRSSFKHKSKMTVRCGKRQDIWCVFRVKHPFSTSSSEVWTDPTLRAAFIVCGPLQFLVSPSVTHSFPSPLPPTPPPPRLRPKGKNIYCCGNDFPLDSE